MDTQRQRRGVGRENKEKEGEEEEGRKEGSRRQPSLPYRAPLGRAVAP